MRKQTSNSRGCVRRRGRCRGFSLVEALMASVVLAAAVIGIGATLGATYKQTTVTEESGIALDLGRSLMEEVSAKPFEITSGTNAAGWPSVTNRTLYDTIDDFNGYTDTSDSIKTWNNSTVDVGNGKTYTRTVTVTSNAKPPGLTGNSSDFYLVMVTVTAPTGEQYSISQLCTRTTVVR
ncbi:MAG TPA: hypothetical protein VF669_06005 [Tepidisphaeraceae bacterium]|jgi:Tfp pilus assembly protein PilV